MPVADRRRTLRRFALLSLANLLFGMGCSDGSTGSAGAQPSDGGSAADADAGADAGADAIWPEAGAPDADAAVCEPTDAGWGVPSEGLVGWWPLDGDTQDHGGGGHHCTAVGQAHLVLDPERGDVIELDGDGDYLDCGNAPALDPTHAVTISLWVRVRSFGAAWQAFVSRNGEDCGWSIRRDENDAGADFVLRGTSAADDLRGSRPLDDGAWHHVAGVYDGSWRTLYVDGEVDAQWQDTGSISSCAADHVLIGAMGAESFGYGHLAHDGWLDDVRVYDTALEARSIRILAGKARAASDPSPVDGAQCVDPDVTLSWEPGVGSCRHHVYFGTGKNAVSSASDPNVAPGRGVVDAHELALGALDHHTQYYWRVDEVTPDGIERGPVWSFRTCGEMADGFVRIPAGSFTMGASPGDTQACRTQCGWPFDIEKPHTVHITRDFWIKATEVTHGDWATAFGSTPGVFAACGDDCPVENVTWWQTLAYCNQLSQQEGMTPCYYTDEAGTAAYDLAAAGARLHPYWVQGPACPGYRLPTEAEWEYAARAGTDTPVFLGEATETNVSQIAWYAYNSQCSYAACEGENCRDSVGIPPSGTHPVGQKAPNAWGLFDTSGNVWEFVWDVFGEYHDGPVSDPLGPITPAAGFHVARGGSWLNVTEALRASTRDGDDATCDPDNGPGCHTGFRIVRTAQ